MISKTAFLTNHKLLRKHYIICQQIIKQIRGQPLNKLNNNKQRIGGVVVAVTEWQFFSVYVTSDSDIVEH